MRIWAGKHWVPASCCPPEQYLPLSKPQLQAVELLSQYLAPKYNVLLARVPKPCVSILSYQVDQDCKTESLESRKAS